MIALFQHIPALLKMCLVFVFVLYAIRRKISLGNAFMLGALALSLFFTMPIQETLKSFFLSIVYPKTLSLALVVSLILALSSSMEETGQMQRLLARFRGLVSSPRLKLVTFPALIGLLPMPGGAVFSAPMVKEMGGDSTLSGDELSFINYWFRHIWEYWWPMYPGVLLATSMADINLLAFVAMMFPVTIAVIYLGSLPVKGLNSSRPESSKPGFTNQGSSTSEKTVIPKPSLGPFLHELVPIMIVIIPGLGLGMLFSLMYPNLNVAKELGLIISLFVALVWIWRENRLSAGEIKKIVLNGKMFNMVYMVISILVFKGILEDSRAVEVISNELILLHIPLAAIALMLPFIVGLFTGITIAFVGSTFPILISLLNSQGETAFMSGYIMIGLICGFSGVLLSPLHLCLLLSNEYFDTTLNHVYRHLWRPCIWLLVLAMTYFWLLKSITSYFSAATG